MVALIGIMCIAILIVYIFSLFIERTNIPHTAFKAIAEL